MITEHHIFCSVCACLNNGIDGFFVAHI